MKIVFWKHKKQDHLKPVNEMSSDDIYKLRLKATRDALHHAVDLGLFDDKVSDILQYHLHPYEITQKSDKVI